MSGIISGSANMKTVSEKLHRLLLWPPNPNSDSNLATNKVVNLKTNTKSKTKMIKQNNNNNNNNNNIDNNNNNYNYVTLKYERANLRVALFVGFLVLVEDYKKVCEKRQKWTMLYKSIIKYKPIYKKNIHLQNALKQQVQICDGSSAVIHDNNNNNNSIIENKIDNNLIGIDKLCYEESKLFLKVYMYMYIYMYVCVCVYVCMYMCM